MSQFRLIHIGRNRTARMEVPAPDFTPAPRPRQSPNGASRLQALETANREFARQRRSLAGEKEPIRYGPVRFVDRQDGQCVHILSSGLCCGEATANWRRQYCDKHHAEVHRRPS